MKEHTEYPKGATIEERIQIAIGSRWKGVVHSDRHCNRARAVARLFPGLTPKQFDQSAVIAALEANHSTMYRPSTVNKYLGVLSGLGFDVEFQQEIQEEARVLTDEEMEQLDQNVRDAESAPALKAVYAVLRDSGCRGLTELERLDWRGIDWERKTFRLTSKKGNKTTTRIVPMTPVTERALAWLNGNGRRSALPTPGSWRAFWIKVRLDKRNRPYDLRHSFCSRLLHKAVPPVTVQKIMGHSRLEQTMAYFHWTTDALEGVREALSIDPKS